MKISTTKSLIYLLILVLISSCKIKTVIKVDNVKPQELINKTLYNTILEQDRIYFEAYNTCDLILQNKMIPEDLEFYHDKGGLMTSKSDYMEGLKNNICGKVTRQLVAGSVEVFPINNFGAVQIGMHTFYNNQEPNAISKPSKFIVIWKKEANIWQMSRVVSLH